MQYCRLDPINLITTQGKSMKANDNNEHLYIKYSKQLVKTRIVSVLFVTAAYCKMMRSFIKLLAWLPVVIINAIIAWSYFAYMVIFGFGTVSKVPERIVYLTIYNPIFVIFMVSYWRTILCSPGRVPDQFYLSPNDKERYDGAENPQAVIDDLAKNLPIVTKSATGGHRFCEICQLIKPDRCHHCSMCDSCILKMDHHCPWVNNCVGYGNYKYFFLFLFHGIIYTMFVAVTTFKYFLKFWEAGSPKPDSSLHVLFLFFISAMFFVSLWSLFGYHIYLLLYNRTTLESFRAPVFSSGPDKDGFNLGKMNNFRQVFGTNKWLWFIPAYTTMGNGHMYPVGTSQCPESEGLLNGQAFDRNLHICSEQEHLLGGEGNSLILRYNMSHDEEEGIEESCGGGLESDSEVNFESQKSNDHVALGIISEASKVPMHPL